MTGLTEIPIEDPNSSFLISSNLFQMPFDLEVEAGPLLDATLIWKWKEMKWNEMHRDHQLI